MDSKEQLRERAYSTAKAITGYVAIDNDVDLKNALQEYSEKQFKDTFDYDYGTIPPDYASDARLGRYDLLQSTQENPAELTPFVTTYLNGVDILDGETKGLVADDLVAQFKSFAQDHIIGDWTSAKFDQTYKSPLSEQNSVRASGIIIYFFGHEIPVTTEEIWITYIYMLGIFYEATPAKPIIERDILEELSHSLEDQIETKQPSDKLETLEVLLLQFSKQQFSRSFNFLWNGENTEVPEGDSMKLAYSVLLYFGDNPSDEKIETCVSKMTFGEEGTEFPSIVVQADLFNDLVDSIKYITKSPYLPKDSATWYDVSRERSFSIDPEDIQSRLVKQYTTFVYTYGRKSEQDVHVGGYLLYYLSVFSNIAPPPFE